MLFRVLTESSWGDERIEQEHAVEAINRVEAEKVAVAEELAIGRTDAFAFGGEDTFRLDGPSYH